MHEECYAANCRQPRSLGHYVFGTSRTIVLDPQQPPFEKMAASVFHSTNLTADGSRLFFLVGVGKTLYLDLRFR